MGQPTQTDGVRVVILAITAVFGAMLLLSAPIMALDLNAAQQNLASVVLSAFAFFFVIMGMARVYGLSYSGFGWRTVPAKALFQGVLLGILLMPVCGLLAAFIRTLRGGSWENPQLESFDVSGLGLGAEILITMSIIVVMPLLEELFFRGLIFSQLKAARGRSMAIFGSALVFALFHLQIDLVVGTFVLGVAMGFLRDGTGSVLPGFALHATNNGLAWILAYQGLGI